MTTSIYGIMVDMSRSQSLMARVAACAAQQGNTTPNVWASNNLLPLVAQADASLTAAWQSAMDDPDGNPDIGKRDDVVTDAMILAAVNNRKASQGPGIQGWPTSP